MIGWLRFGLALVVMEGHLVGQFALGRGAVPIFYWLSGLLMTGVFAEKYKGDRQSFLISRALRIYPVYWLCYFFFLVSWLFIDSGVTGMSNPGTAGRILEFVGIVRPAHPSVIPQGFAVTFELICYGLVSVGAFSSAKRTLAIVTASLALSNQIYKNELWQAFYFSPFCAIVFFGLGALAYWQGVKLPRDSGRAVLTGALSYPIFLSHWGVGAIVAQSTALQGWPLFFAALPPTLALSWLLVVAVERPIARYRKTFQSPSKEI